MTTASPASAAPASATSASATTSITTRRGLAATVHLRGPADGAPLLYLHGTFGIEPDLGLLDELGNLGWRVHAPVLPGYGDEDTERELRDLLDFTLHGWDLADALDLTGRAPAVVGHSYGAMIAAEMAAVAPTLVGRLALISPLGVWMDEQPIPDVFALLPFELAQVLFTDPTTGIGALLGGANLDDPKAMEGLLVRNARRLGTAGKLLFPIPNRGFSGRAYRLTVPTSLIWGAGDVLVPPEPYARGWSRLLPDATILTIDGCAHMCTYEKPIEVASAVAGPSR